MRIEDSFFQKICFWQFKLVVNPPPPECACLPTNSLIWLNHAPKNQSKVGALQMISIRVECSQHVVGVHVTSVSCRIGYILLKQNEPAAWYRLYVKNFVQQINRMCNCNEIQPKKSNKKIQPTIWSIFDSMCVYYSLWFIDSRRGRQLRDVQCTVRQL